MKTVGIVGYGSFGKFLAEKLDDKFEIAIFSRRQKPGQGNFVSLEDIARADYLILCIPLSAYRAYLTKLKPHLSNKTVIIDVCSIKVRSLQIIKNILPNQPVVATHPLFGPESGSKSLEGLTLVICPELSDKVTTDKLIKYAKLKGLKVLLESAEAHDKQMATVHALTFFIARALDKFQLKSHELDTPSYKRLLYLAELDKHHSQELFDTIQSGNLFAKDERQKLMTILSDLNNEIDNRIT